MRYLLAILLLTALPGIVRAQDTAQLGTVVRQLDKALIAGDSLTLKALLHPALGYGHSNGWTETREEVIADLFSGRLRYEAIEPLGAPVLLQERQTGIVREDQQVRVVLDGKPLALKLRVLQVWVRRGEGWQLIGRQSVRID